MVPVKDLVRDVSRTSGVPAAKILGQSREYPVARIRHAIVFVLLHKQGAAVGVVSRALNLERTSVRYGANKFERLLRAGDPETLRRYRTTIRCYVRLKQQQKRYAEGVRHVTQNYDRVCRPGRYAGDDHALRATA